MTSQTRPMEVFHTMPGMVQRTTLIKDILQHVLYQLVVNCFVLVFIKYNFFKDSDNA